MFFSWNDDHKTQTHIKINFPEALIKNHNWEIVYWIFQPQLYITQYGVIFAKFYPIHWFLIKNHLQFIILCHFSHLTFIACNFCTHNHQCFYNLIMLTRKCWGRKINSYIKINFLSSYMHLPFCTSLLTFFYIFPKPDTPDMKCDKCYNNLYEKSENKDLQHGYSFEFIMRILKDMNNVGWSKNCSKC